MRALLEPIGEELSLCPLNFSVLPVADSHLLTIAFDVEASFDTVQTVGREGAAMLTEILRASVVADAGVP